MIHPLSTVLRELPMACTVLRLIGSVVYPAKGLVKVRAASIIVNDVESPAVNWMLRPTDIWPLELVAFSVLWRRCSVTKQRH
jgi:hypothetical protein